MPVSSEIPVKYLVGLMSVEWQPEKVAHLANRLLGAIPLPDGVRRDLTKGYLETLKYVLEYEAGSRKPANANDVRLLEKVAPTYTQAINLILDNDESPFLGYEGQPTEYAGARQQVIAVLVTQEEQLSRAA